MGPDMGLAAACSCSRAALEPHGFDTRRQLCGGLHWIPLLNGKGLCQCRRAQVPGFRYATKKMAPKNGSTYIQYQKT